MGLITPARRTRAAWLLVAALVAAALVDGIGVWRVARLNQRIAAGQVFAPVGPPGQASAPQPAPGPAPGSAPEAVPGGAPGAASEPAPVEPELRFAQAHALAASGATEVALNRYRALQADASPLGQAARFNSANLLLCQAMQLRDGSQPGQAIAPIELAKESLRQVLRRDPQHWDARYNLERAQRLLPDPEEADDEPPEPARERERAATTMRGVSPGLP